MTPPPNPKVLYVLGTQRGGTTIAGRLAGQLPGFIFVGELRKLWQVGLAEQRRCGCGLSYVDCEVWSAVLADVLKDTDAAQVQRWQSFAVPDRRSSLQAWRLVRHRDRRRADAISSYASMLAATYRAVTTVTGSRVLVDTSKLPADAALVSRLEGIDAFFVHLVRDPRGTVNSTMRRRGDRGGSHLTQSVSGSAGWLVRHLVATFLRRRVGAGRSVVISYEHMVSDPNGVLARIADLVGETPPPKPVVVGGRVDLAVAHTPIGGGRFRPATVQLTLDERWRAELATLDRFVVAGLTQPLARRFGYRLRGSGPAQ